MRCRYMMMNDECLVMNEKEDRDNDDDDKL